MAVLIECVPNFSEGRDKARVDAIVSAMLRDGVYLLDREMDADHSTPACPRKYGATLWPPVKFHFTITGFTPMPYTLR